MMDNKQISINDVEIEAESLQSGHDTEGYYVIIRIGHGMAGRSMWDRLRIALDIFPN
jgi:hypothetical protein